ncbi:EGF-like calcium-binding domain [Dillenia turbinata]|uniref:EGF-like calcium-binding domain n=1 Tax=Dillenia turbinata TaxID=194707 RepID=A0AAN8VYC9_9MAGN
MASSRIMCLMLEAIALIRAASIAATSESQALPNCQASCGNISIPYPFGIGQGCSIDNDFLITCNTTTNNAYLGTGNLNVLSISLDGQLRILAYAAYDCYNESGKIYQNKPWLNLSKFPLSHTQNKFTAVGCDTYAFVEGSEGKSYATGCIAMCNQNDTYSLDTSCSGIGCCQTSIPKGVRGYSEISVSSYYNHSYVLNFNPCSHAFVAEINSFNFSVKELGSMPIPKIPEYPMPIPKIPEYPVVLDWTLGNQTCDEAKTTSDYACKENSDCYEPDNGPGYRCSCSEGYQGNPFLSDSFGCQDINECLTSNQCDGNASCVNLPGTYNCSCLVGYEGDGWKNQTGCKEIINQDSKSLSLTNIALDLSLKTPFSDLKLIYVHPCRLQKDSQ